MLMVDCPGSGEALRFQGLTARVETEVWAAACVDYLETRDDVDADRIGLVGWSLGGYYARGRPPSRSGWRCRGLGRQPRLGRGAEAPAGREGENPVPHYWDHVLWVWGCDDLEKFIK